MKTVRGIVLVELIVVLVVMAMITATVVPLYQHMGRWSLRTAAAELAVRIRETRHTAISSGQTCTIVFYEFSGRYKLDYPEGITWVWLPEGVNYAGNNFPLKDNRPTLSFRYTGAPNQGGHVVLKDQKGNRLYVIVTPVTGRVRIDSEPP
ncbi:MAG: GspH/FimT family protein [Clostridiales bacterium]|jgi:Tfp pilus assembly protein FimT|nr:GspH/FimT family protein [Clostridiales bacterium]